MPPIVPMPMISRRPKIWLKSTVAVCGLVMWACIIWAAIDLATMDEAASIGWVITWMIATTICMSARGCLIAEYDKKNRQGS